MKEPATKKRKAARPKALSPEESNGKPKPPRAKARVQAEQLTAELDGLRASLNEMVDRYKLKLDAELIQIDEAVRGGPSYVGRSKPLPSRVTAAMLKRIKDLEIKPHKGRAKDLVRVQDLVVDLIELLPAK
jgi:hypothetical protein